MAENGVDELTLFSFLISILPIIVYSQNGSSSSIAPTSTSPSVNTSHPTVHPTSSIATFTGSFTIHSRMTPVLTSSPAPPSKTSITPTSTSSAVINVTSSIRPTATPTVHPTASVNFTTVQPPTTTAKPTTVDCDSCEKQLASERRYKWAAVSFDIIFALALVVMTILYLRQRKMYRDMEGDGSLSRLI